MSKPKNKTSKILVRNVSAPVRPCKVPQKPKLKKVHFLEEENSVESNHSKCLKVPEFSTLLQLANEMQEIRNSQGSSRSMPETTRCRNLDFLPEEKVFHDLVDLDPPEDQLLNRVKSQISRISLQKDPEPDYSKYLKYDLPPENFFTSCVLPPLKKEKPVFDGRSIYNKLRMWKEMNEMDKTY